MNVAKFREIIRQRLYAEEISHGEWYEEIERCQKEVVDILKEDIPSTIDFLKTECTAEEYSWIAEVLEDVVLVTSDTELVLSRELVECVKALMEKFPEECETYNISGDVERAENVIKWEEERGKEN